LLRRLSQKERTRALRHVLHNQPYFLETKSKTGIQAEEAVFIFSETLGLDLVPPTKVTQFRHVEGSFQLMVPQVEGFCVEEFKKIRNLYQTKSRYTSEEIQLFQYFAVFDVLIGNLDRHDRNWFVAYKKEGSRITIYKIFAIDHDRCFIRQNPSSILAMRSQYAWRDCSISREPMTHETKRFIQNNLQQEQVKKVVETVNKEIMGFFTRRSMERTYQRVKVLQILAENSDSVTFDSFGTLRSDREIEVFLSHC